MHCLIFRYFQLVYLDCSVQGQVVKRCGEDPRCATDCVNRFFFRTCRRICNGTGVCECPAGTIIDKDSNKCVNRSECPKSKS